MKKLIVIIQLAVLLVSCTGNKKTTTLNTNTALNPNIVIIMADDLGYGDISCYGNTITHTPNLDLLAAKGVKFMDFHSNGSVCSPTRAALMTGQYQQRTGISSVVTAKSHRNVGLNLNQVTIAEEFKKHGYNCGMFGKWHLGYAKKYNPTLQGFDDFRGFVSGNVDYHAHIDQQGYLDWWKGTEVKDEEGYSTDLITKYGVEYIKAHDQKKTGKPFFLYLPHEAPHGPYQRRIDVALRQISNGKKGGVNIKPVDRERKKKENIQSIYKEMVEVMDEGIGEIVKILKETGQYENTIILFLSDNGANRFGNNGGLKGNKGSAYEGGSRVPAILNYPKLIKNPAENNQTILTMDILPTMLDFINKKPTVSDLDGISVKDNILNNTDLPKRDIFFSYSNRSYVRSGDWKLVQTKKEQGDRVELYNLSNDVQEENNLRSDNPDLLNELIEKFNTWEKEVNEGVEVISK